MFADRLRALREKAGISARELDRLAGLREGHTWILEHRKDANPELKTLQALAGALGSSVGYLASEEGEPPTEEQVKAAVAQAKGEPAPDSPPATGTHGGG